MAKHCLQVSMVCSLYQVTDNWTIIFNKTWKQWGAFTYKERDDALRVTGKSTKSCNFCRKNDLSIDKNGVVTLWWGDLKVPFTVE
jgi:hypothetical protein